MSQEVGGFSRAAILHTALTVCRGFILRIEHLRKADNRSETAFQLKNTGAQLVLVEPPFVDVVLKAADKVNFPHDRILLFSDEHCSNQKGLCDWSSILGTTQEAEQWQWHRMTSEESKTRVAVLNYSSGTTGLPSKTL